MAKKKQPKWKAAGYQSKSAYYRDHPAGQKRARKRRIKPAKAETHAIRLDEFPAAMFAGACAQVSRPEVAEAFPDAPEFRDVEEAANDDQIPHIDSGEIKWRPIKDYASGAAPFDYTTNDRRAAMTSLENIGLTMVTERQIALSAQLIAIERRQAVKSEHFTFKHILASAEKKVLAETMIAFGRRLLDQSKDKGDSVLIDFSLTRKQVEVLMEGLFRVSQKP